MTSQRRIMPNETKTPASGARDRGGCARAENESAGSGANAQRDTTVFATFAVLTSWIGRGFW